MEKQKLLDKIRYHWHSYVARGGFDEPSTLTGRLEKGGQEHWTSFLSLGRRFVVDFPSSVKEIDFINPPIIRMLTGA